MFLIESYSFGRIVIDGKIFTSDVIIYPDKVDDSWWRKRRHILQKEDLIEVVKCNPEILIVGTGANGLMIIPDETKKFVKSKGIELISKETREACDVYNGLKGSRKIVAALHITC
jgi:hypothetical protein